METPERTVIGTEYSPTPKADEIHANDVISVDVESDGVNKIMYGVEDVPPWYLCFSLGFQVTCCMFYYSLLG